MTSRVINQDLPLPITILDAYVYRVVGTKTLCAQETQANGLYEKFLDRVEIERVTFSTVVLNTRTLIASAIKPL